MRSLLVLLLLLALAGAIAWSLTGHPEVAPPATDAPPEPARGTRQEPADSERARLPAPVVPPPPVTVDEVAPLPPPLPTAGPGNVHIAVKDIVQNQPVAAFSWTFVHAGGRLRGEATAAACELALPAGSQGELLVEADGYAPFQRQALPVPAANEAPLSLAVFLTPAVVAPGITLFVHDTALQPVPHARVDAFTITDDNRVTNWSLDQPLWARRTSAADGRYRLPPLPAGEYGIRLVATDVDGALLPLLPYARTFVLTGDNGFVEDVPLETGCLPVFELVDQNGALFDPATFGTATLALRHTGGPAVQRKWLVSTATAAAAAIDVLPGVGAVSTAEAVPAGLYTFEVFVGGAPRVARPLALRAGERQVERVLVP